MISTPSDRKPRSDPWADDEDAAGTAQVKSLTREQAQALVANDPHSVSPWWVIAAQAGIGVLAALVAWLFTAREDVVWSALYGAAVVVVPGALMARGMTSRLSGMSPGVSAVSFMFWALAKIGVSVAMLLLAPWLLQPLSWPALLVSMVLCMKVYWLALRWRGR